MANAFSRLFGPRTGRKSRLSPDGMPVTEFPAPVVQLLRLYGAGGSHASVYASQPNVRTAVDIIAREAASLGAPKLYEKVPRSDVLPAGRLEIGNHPLVDVLHEPAPGISEFDFYYALFADIAIYDLAIWMKIRDGLMIRSLVRIPPANLTPERHPITGHIMYWRAADGSRVMPSELVVFWGYDPAVNSGNIPPLQTLRRLIAEELAAGENREGMWQNALRKDGLIEQDVAVQKMSDEARESYLIDLEDALSGASNTGRPLMLEPGHHYQDVQWSPKEAEYIAGRKLSRLEVASAYHMPPAMMAAADSGAEPDEATLDFFNSSTLPPWLTRVEGTIKAQLLPEFDMVKNVRRRRYLEFNMDEKLRGSFEKKAAIMATTAGGPVVLVNEGRARLNLPPIAGGDQIIVPLNSVLGGGPQASPQSPVQTPAPGVQPAGTTPQPELPTQRAASLSPISGATIGDEVLAQALTDVGIPVKSTDEVKAIYEAALERDAAVKARDEAEAEAKAAEHAAFMRGQREKFEERYVTTIRRTFGRMRNAVEGGKTFKTDRWRREFGDDLFGVSFQTVDHFGADAAERIGGVWNPDRTATYLRKGAEIVADRETYKMRDRLAEENPDLDTIFGDDHALTIARTETTRWMNWAVLEAAKQNGE